MENRGSKTKTLTVVVIFTTVLGMLLISVRCLTQEILVYKLGIDNKFTHTILFDSSTLDDASGENTVSSVNIDWANEYPFSKKDLESKSTDTTTHIGSYITKYGEVISNLEDRVSRGFKTFLPGYKLFVELSNLVEQKAGWNFVNYSEYNGLIMADNNYYIDIKPKQSISECADSTIELDEFCKKKGINFLYVQQPNKTCKIEDKNIDGSLDFSNYNADSFLGIIKKAGVDCHDHREDIHSDNLNHHSLFYGTDHHWKAENGCWAAKHLLEKIAEKYGYDINTDLLSMEHFTKKTYKNRFFGSQGKKVGLKVAHPDDFTMLYPKYDTKFHFIVPNKGIDKTGDFRVTYDMNQVRFTDYYHSSEYAAYNYSIAPVHKIDNLKNKTGPKVLLIADSFADCELSFIALGVNSLESLDLRFFTGSVKTYIETSKPDIVIVAYVDFHAPIDWESHTAKFDFR